MPKKILIVEDETFSAMWLKQSLSETGYEILDLVATGEEAIRTAIQYEPNYILMDIQLAGNIDGIEAAARIEETVKSRMPGIIFMTGYSISDFIDRINKIEHIAIVPKPVDLNKLIKFITQQ